VDAAARDLWVPGLEVPQVHPGLSRSCWTSRNMRSPGLGPGRQWLVVASGRQERQIRTCLSSMTSSRDAAVPMRLRIRPTRVACAVGLSWQPACVPADRRVGLVRRLLDNVAPERSFWRVGQAVLGLESAFGTADSLCQTLGGLSEDGYQVPAGSGVDRGKVVGEKVIAPAGTIHGKAMIRYLLAWTAGSRSLSARASLDAGERMDRPRSGEVRSSSRPAASRCPGLVQVGEVGRVRVLPRVLLLR